ncbi:MAG: 3-phosphoshikimate 1-carboxyvinyltransferase [Bacteroidetes bacterium]|nr:3-phosphoshikimate 1-carboxyvinyltransferase [Bacteroidota bacterium]
MILQPGLLKGILNIPPSKSDAQRAILAAGLSVGTSILRNVGKSNDEVQMLENIRLIGARIIEFNDRVEIEGVGGFPKNTEMNLGESGLGFRLIAGQCAIRGGNHVLSASGTLVNRPMDFYQQQFKETDLKVSSAYAPITFKGFSNKNKFVLDGSQSSQFISGLLMALPLAEFDSEIIIENLKSRPYLEMTLATMNQFCIQIIEKEGDHFIIKGGQKYQAQEYMVESDWSAASCWLAASALGSAIELQGLSMKSLQADKQMLRALVGAGCKIVHGENGLTVEGKNRRSFEFDATDCPDLFPALVVLAALTEGQSTIFGLNRLKIKESDRGIALQQELLKMGVQIDLFPDQDKMSVLGVKSLLSSAFSAHDDHRIAMAIGVLSSFMSRDCHLEGKDSVKKSYPDFWEHRSALIT